MPHTANDPRFDALIDPDVPVRQLCSGFAFIEGPIWNPANQCLLFSDIIGNARYRWTDGKAEKIAMPTHNANGMTLDAELNLLVCEHATSVVSRIAPGGPNITLCSHFEGRELNSPNDICVRADGSIWFTDPAYGRTSEFGIERHLELGFRGVYCLSPDHEPGDEPTLMVHRDLFTEPNGLCFSPCETMLYVNDSEQANIRVFNIVADGSLSEPRMIAEDIRTENCPGVPDGMRTDERGNIWVTAPGGLRIYNPDGTLLGQVNAPEPVANFHWGGEEWRTLFLCANTSLYSVETKVRCHAEPFMSAY